jgi:hypothetical protein
MTDLSLWEAMHEAQERELADNPHAELAEVYGAMIRAVAGWMRTHQDPRRPRVGNAARARVLPMTNPLSPAAAGGAPVLQTRRP